MSLKISAKPIVLFMSLLFAGLWSFVVVMLFQGWGGFEANISLAFIGVISMPYVLLIMFNLTLYKSNVFPHLVPLLVLLLVIFFMVPSEVPTEERLAGFIFFLFFILFWGGYHMIYWRIIKPRLSLKNKS